MITAELYRNGAESMAGLADLVSGADRSVLGDAFRYSDRSVVDATKDSLARGAQVDLLHSWYKEVWRSGELSKSELKPLGANFRPIHVMQHSKGVLVDDQELWVSSGAIGKATRGRNDIALRMTGPAAEAYGVMTRASIAGDRDAAFAGARDAREAGLLANDPLTGAHFLTTSVDELVRDEPAELEVISKSLRDRSLATALARRAREIPVHVTARDISMEIEEQLRRAGADVTRVDDPRHLFHTNIVAGSNQAYFGSGHLTPRALNRDSARSTSRELGYLVNGETDPATLAQVRDVAQHIRSAATPAVGSHSLQSRFEYWVRSRFGGGFD